MAREVGTEGKLGGQADVQGVAGTWKDLTDNVNFMAGNLTSQVRGIAKVVTAVANGDLDQKLTVEAKGEIAALADTINSMTDTLATFADQVTTVAREVGVEGKLGGQANVPGAAGTWKGLTENVNQLAANLTTQVRAIAEVATAVTQGDLTRSITVEAQGEVAALKDTINEMIRNLQRHHAQEHRAGLAQDQPGQVQPDAAGAEGPEHRWPLDPVRAGAGGGRAAGASSTFWTPAGRRRRLVLLASYGGDGQGALGKPHRAGRKDWSASARSRSEKILLSNVPLDYIRDFLRPGRRPAAEHPRAAGDVRRPGQGRARAGVVRALQPSAPGVPRPADGEHRHRDQHDRSEHADRRPAHAVAVAGPGTAKPAAGTAADQPGAQEKAGLLAHQNQEVERKNQEVEQARQALEEKAEQLALTSKYKSEFLANMSHELRTPLNQPADPVRPAVAATRAAT